MVFLEPIRLYRAVKEAPVARVTGWDTVFPLKRAEHHYLPSAPVK